MVISGLIPDTVDVRSAKRVLRELRRCPECGGQGYTVYGSDPPEQQGCQTCRGPDDSDKFWSDGLEYYVETGTTAMDLINCDRMLRDESVCYGFFLMRQNGFGLAQCSPGSARRRGQ